VSCRPFAVDIHKKTHVLVTINVQGQTCGTHTMTNTPSGWVTVLRWALKMLASMFGILCANAL
jgi:hypothetical protein